MVVVGGLTEVVVAVRQDGGDMHGNSEECAWLLFDGTSLWLHRESVMSDVELRLSKLMMCGGKDVEFALFASCCLMPSLDNHLQQTDQICKRMLNVIQFAIYTPSTLPFKLRMIHVFTQDSQGPSALD